MENQCPRVSVIVPVYNVEAYLERCVESLIHQTYKNLDIILVDDGSPDRCPAMCDDFAARHENITALHKKNGGLSDARNFGVRHTNNDWIVFVDSDDYVEPKYVETMVKLRDQFDAEMVVTRTVRENEDGSGKPAHRPFESYLADNNAALYQIYSGMNVGWAAYGKLFPTAVLLKHPFPDGYYEDCACMYKIVDEFRRIAIGDYENNYHYIQREGSILGSNVSKKHFRIFDIAKEFESFIHEKHPDLDILIVFIYKRAVTQLLNLQKMPWKTYKEIYYRYRPLFRRSAKRILTDKSISKDAKIYHLLLCLRPEIFYAQRQLLIRTR